MAQGACNCGAVAFEINAALKDIYVCHCSICRNSTGGQGIPVVIVDNTAFRFLRGANLVTTWKKPDADWLSAFCSICGSPLPRANDSAHMAVPVGLIREGGEDLMVAHRIWVGSKDDWEHICDGAKLHKEGFEP